MDELGAMLVGLAGGVIAGLMGVGGGVLFVPGLVYFLDQSQLQAEATSLLAIVPVAAVGAWRQRAYGNVRLTDALTLGILAPLGVIAGVVVANSIGERALELGFATLLLAVAFQLTRRALGAGR